MNDGRSCVLDASALIALLRGEPGAEIVEAEVDRAVLSTVNWAEVYQRSVSHKVDLSGLRDDVEALGLEIIPFTVEDAEWAAVLQPATRHLGLSLADRACLALAARLELPALTADRTWLGHDLGIEIKPIR